MCNWKKWILPGILAVGLLTVLAIFTKSQVIEQDLKVNALENLNAQYDWADVEMDGRDLKLTGQSPSEKATSDALAAAEKAYDVRVASADVSYLPIAEPYTFSATKSENKLVMDGYIMSESDRLDIIASAKSIIPGIEIIDNITLARGAPDKFAGLAGFGLAQLGKLENGELSISDANLTLNGHASTVAAYHSITDLLSGTLPGGGNLLDSEITYPIISPYTFKALKVKGKMTLEGYVQSASDKQDLLKYASKINEGDNIIDRVVTGEGIPEGMNWDAATKFAIEQASLFLDGNAAISDNSYTVDGMASSNENYKNIITHLDQTLPGGLALASQSISRPVISPYVWSFTNTEGSPPTLEGYVPDEETAAQILEQIASRLGSNTTIISNWQIADGNSEGFKDAISVGIQAASRLFNGKAEISGSELSVTGNALSQAALEEISQNIQDVMPEGYVGKHDISIRKIDDLKVLETDECQGLLKNKLGENKIHFETAKAVIKPDSYGLLDRLAFVTKRCPTSNVAVEGHTDSDGEEDYNQVLSEQRANAVRSYLVKSGIFVGRLKAIGYGELSPIGDNSTEDGKAQNRRIEFTVTR